MGVPIWYASDEQKVMAQSVYDGEGYFVTSARNYQLRGINTN